MDLIKRKKRKQKRFIKTKDFLSQVYTTVGTLLFTNTRISKTLLEILLLQTKETIGLKPTNEDQNKALAYRKVPLDKAFKLYNTLLEIYTYQFNRLH